MKLTAFPAHRTTICWISFSGDEWGFDGFVITDCGAINMLAYGHDIAKDGEDAAAIALKAGVDMEMSGEMFGKHLLNAIENHTVTESVLDEAVRRVLKTKFMLGLFERPYVDPEVCRSYYWRARNMSSWHAKWRAEGIILLKNDAGMLPLSKETGKIAVIGPNAHHIYNQLGDYTSPQPRHRVVTLVDGIRNALGEDGRERSSVCPRLQN